MSGLWPFPLNRGGLCAGLGHSVTLGADHLGSAMFGGGVQPWMSRVLQHTVFLYTLLNHYF
jgi:hypothetical protein